MANGSQEPLTPPLLVPAPVPLLGDAPLSVGSYPSAKSFLGIWARELFRNKSESQCETGSCQAPPTQHCTEPIGSAGASSTSTRAPHAMPTRDEHPDAQGGGAGAGHAQHSQLSIMDYNEAHHEHSWSKREPQEPLS
ncbi:hamartin-like [Megalops cyprinoides]|uniref:hamartin-like n=1 Tax=Megalops cyprinoides TaxID=118141 RepID=UPI00186444B4|nr:hamartin-like [Megalops cyprinoides]